MSFGCKNEAVHGDDAVAPRHHTKTERLVLVYHIMSSHHNPEVSVPPIKEYLSQLYRDPDEMLEMMSLTSTYISGSRAAGYFYPWAVGDSSDWDIYCVGSAVQRRTFRLWMNSIGFRVRDRSHTYGDESISRVITGELLNNEGTSNTVQLISPTRQDIISTVLDFNHTLPMCYISGSHAASLFHVSSSKKISWIREVTEHEIATTSEGFVNTSFSHSNISMVMIKYMGRGVIFCTSLLAGKYPVNPKDSPPVWNRRVGDEYSALVEFPAPERREDSATLSDLRSAMLTNIKSSAWYSTPSCHHPSTCRPDFRVLVDDVRIGSRVRHLLLQHAVRLKSIVILMTKGPTHSCRYHGDNCTVMIKYNEGIVAYIYPKLTGAAGSEDWDSLGDHPFPTTSMRRLAEAVSMDHIMNREAPPL